MPDTTNYWDPTAADINNIYQSLFGRDAEAAGQTYWQQQGANAGNYDQLYNWIRGGAQGTDIAAIAAPDTGFDAGANVNQIYNNLFGRDAEQQGRDYWSTRGATSYDQLYNWIRGGAQTEDIEARDDTTRPGYSGTWDPTLTATAGQLQYDPTANKWSRTGTTTVVTPPGGGTGAHGGATDTEILGGGIGGNTPLHDTTTPIFNIDSETDPYSGRNWRDTWLAGSGHLDNDEAMGDLYEQMKGWAQNPTGALSLSGMAEKFNLPPGVAQAYYEAVLKWANKKGLPMFNIPDISTINEPYYKAGLNGAQRHITYKDAAGNDLDTLNPLTSILSGHAKGGRIKGGLSALKADPVAQRYVRGGKGGGQADTVPALLSNNEYVFDAATVADLGDGNPDEGARLLDKMRERIRAHKRSASPKSIPPKAKAPEQYLKGK